MNAKRLVSLTKIIIRGFMLTAIAFSFMHIVAAGKLIGLDSVSAWALPFLVDGVAGLGLVWRSEAFSKATNKMGLWTQVTAGALSLACNVTAGHNAGLRAFGVFTVALFLFSEWASGRVQGREVDERREAEIAAAAAAKAAADKLAASQAKAAATRAAKKAARDAMLSEADKVTKAAARKRLQAA